jgi:Na+/proline symporter
MGNITGNIMEVTVRTNHVFVAPLFGLFFMAIFVRSATPFATACGALAGCAVAVVIAYWDLIGAVLVHLLSETQWAYVVICWEFIYGNPAAKLSFQWISLISLIVNLAVAIPLSLLFPRKPSLPRTST